MLDFAVIVLVAVTEIFHGTQGTPILGMMNRNAAIHVLQFDACAAAAQLASQVVANELVTIGMQPEVVIDSAGDRVGLDLRI